MLVAWQLWTKIAVPLNLSFPHTVDVGSFYSDIHANIRQQAAENRLPPTSAEFRDWLARRFADPGGLSALDAGTGAHALNAQACRDAGFGDVTNDGALYERLLQTRMHGMSAGAIDRFKLGGYRHWDMKQMGMKANLPDLLACRCHADGERQQAFDQPRVVRP